MKVVETILDRSPNRTNIARSANGTWVAFRFEEQPENWLCVFVRKEKEEKPWIHHVDGSFDWSQCPRCGKRRGSPCSPLSESEIEQIERLSRMKIALRKKRSSRAAT